MAKKRKKKTRPIIVRLPPHPRRPKARPAPERLEPLKPESLFDSLESPLKELERSFEKSLSRPKVSVVIANHNNVEALWHCLFALKTQAYPAHEIILVDNASEDASVSFVRSNYPQVKILECQENFGTAMGRNLGVKMATGNLVALMEPETVVTPDWLGRMVRDFRLAWPKFGLMASPVRAQGGKGEDQTLNILGSPIEGFYPDPQEIFSPLRGAVLFPRFLAPDGPFDADYYSCQEDAYLGWKFRLSNRPAGWSLETKVFRKTEKMVPEMPEWKILYYEIRNRWLNLFIFYDSGTLLKVLPLVVVEGITRLLRSLATGFGAFWSTLCAMGWIFFHPLLIHKKRLAVQAKRKVSDRGLLGRLSGRLVRDSGTFSRVLNLISLTYCRLVGLEVLEWRE